MFREWQELSQTRIFADSLKQTIEDLKDEAINSSDKLSLEQIAISTIERNASARILEQIIEILTSKEEDDNEQT